VSIEGVKVLWLGIGEEKDSVLSKEKEDELKEEELELEIKVNSAELEEIKRGVKEVELEEGR